MRNYHFIEINIFMVAEILYVSSLDELVPWDFLTCMNCYHIMNQ